MPIPTIVLISINFMFITKSLMTFINNKLIKMERGPTNGNTNNFVMTGGCSAPERGQAAFDREINPNASKGTTQRKAAKKLFTAKIQSHAVKVRLTRINIIKITEPVT